MAITDLHSKTNEILNGDSYFITRGHFFIASLIKLWLLFKTCHNLLFTFI